MERSRDYEDLAVALVEVRPTPRDDFAAELDELVAAGFPRRPRTGNSPLAALAARLRTASPQRLLFASGSTALATIAVATIVVASHGSTPGPVAPEGVERSKQPHQTLFSAPVPKASGQSALPSVGAAGQQGSSETESSSSAAVNGALSELHDSTPTMHPFSRPLGSATHREIERSAEIGLLADPDDVAADSAKVFSAVHNANGIVLHSTTTAGRNAGANFDLLIPSAKLGDALAAFSAIDEVRTRHEATADITAPTVALGEQLQDSQAKIDGLLSQLADAETESESEAIGIELRDERRHAAQLRARLSRLHQRVDFSRVSLRIESGVSSTVSGSGWGIGDAWGDAGHILGIAAVVALIGLALLAPLILVGLLAWLARRAWLRRARERALT